MHAGGGWSGGQHADGRARELVTQRTLGGAASPPGGVRVCDPSMRIQRSPRSALKYQACQWATVNIRPVTVLITMVAAEQC